MSTVAAGTARESPSRPFVVAHGEEEYTILDLLLVAGLEFGNVRHRRRKAS